MPKDNIDHSAEQLLQNNVLLSAKDVCSIFKVSRVTLWREVYRNKTFPEPIPTMGASKAWPSQVIKNLIQQRIEDSKSTAGKLVA